MSRGRDTQIGTWWHKRVRARPGQEQLPACEPWGRKTQLGVQSFIWPREISLPAWALPLHDFLRGGFQSLKAFGTPEPRGTRATQSSAQFLRVGRTGPASRLFSSSCWCLWVLLSPCACSAREEPPLPLGQLLVPVGLPA